MCRFLLVAALINAYTGVALCQNSTGAISGQVRDPSSASIAAARVRVTNQETGLTRVVTTNELGQYTAPSLPGLLNSPEAHSQVGIFSPSRCCPQLS
ncbi:MAG: carboxypeptidase regulatory-like domain-containing protein [Bryobacterales bacterium]|nr:carboxypeptidase regulatory-like domain-containing protein [Bryobacterales bacterium]